MEDEPEFDFDYGKTDLATEEAADDDWTRYAPEGARFNDLSIVDLVQE